MPNFSEDQDRFQFLCESRQNIELFEVTLLDLENNPSDPKLINELFRSIHTIKGASSFLKLIKLEKLSDKLENTLSIHRSHKELSFSSDEISTLLEAASYIHEILNELEEAQSEGSIDTESITKKLEELNNELKDKASTSLVVKKKKTKELSALQKKFLNALNKAKPDATLSKQNLKERSKNISVNSQSIDRLYGNVSELIILRNQLLELTNINKELTTKFSQADTITNKISDSLDDIRTQPLSSITKKIRLSVREVSKELNKDIDFKILGEETRLEKSIIDSLSSPLIHLIRNSIDHGIESIEQRIALNKNKTGAIQLIASNDGQWVYLTLKDDGAGIDINSIKRKALKTKMHSLEQLNSMSEANILNIIFEPGFSTRDEVTKLSGRGVGLDSVLEAITRVSGTIEIKTEKNQGTQFLIKLPLKDSIKKAAIVKLDNQKFAVASEYIKEFASIEAKLLKFSGNVYYAQYKNVELPLFFLKSLFENDTDSIAKSYKMQESIEIIVLEVNDSCFGLVVDSLEELTDIMIKPISFNFKNSKYYSGSSILANGEISFLIDIFKLHKAMGSHTIPESSIHRSFICDKEQDKEQTYLTFELGSKHSYALEITAGTWIRKLDPNEIKEIDSTIYIESEAKKIMLIDLANKLPDCSKLSDQKYLICFEHKGVSLGIPVTNISSLEERDLDLELFSDARYDFIPGKAIINDKHHLLIDINKLIKQKDSLLEEYSKFSTHIVKNEEDSSKAINRYISFHTGGYLLGINFEKVKEVYTSKKAFSMNSTHNIDGAINFRGSVVFSKDLSEALNIDKKSELSQDNIIVKSGNKLISFAVEDIDSSIEIPQSENSLNIEEENCSFLEYIQAIYPINKKSKIYILDIEKVIQSLLATSE